VHLATHSVEILCVVHAGSIPPFTTTVAQHSAFAPPQSLGFRHSSVSSLAQDDEHAGVPASTRVQQASPFEH
jgi:hypothetical protein